MSEPEGKDILILCEKEAHVLIVATLRKTLCHIVKLQFITNKTNTSHYLLCGHCEDFYKVYFLLDNIEKPLLKLTDGNMTKRYSVVVESID